MLTRTAELRPFMKRNDFSWMIGGAQGSGVDTSANIFAKAAAQGGLQVYGNREYYSNIKGEHSYFQGQARAGGSSGRTSTPWTCSRPSTTRRSRATPGEVREDGAIIYDPALGREQDRGHPTIEPNVDEAPLRGARRERPAPHRRRGPRGREEEGRPHLRDPVHGHPEEGRREDRRDLPRAPSRG